jgi:hypothetical protein
MTRSRLFVAYALLGLAVVAVAAISLYFGLIRSNKVTPWSTWKPTSSDLQRELDQIASHVSQRYRLASGKPQANIHFGPLQVVDQQGQVQIQVIGIASTPKAAPSFLAYTKPGDTVLFQLCGVGKNCPPVENGALSNAGSYMLRQEGLELTLYTLKYVPAIQTVVVFMGPKPFDPGRIAQVYLRGPLEPLLSLPLEQTVGAGTPPVEQKLSRAERRRIASHSGHVYQWTVAKAPNGQPAMVIAPVKEPTASG